MPKNRSQRYADYLCSEAITFTAEQDKEPEKLLANTYKLLEENMSSKEKKVRYKAKELAKDVPMNVDSLLEMSKERIERAKSPIREGGFTPNNERTDDL